MKTAEEKVKELTKLIEEIVSTMEKELTPEQHKKLYGRFFRWGSRMDNIVNPPRHYRNGHYYGG